MPQSITSNWKIKDNPYGKGSLHGDLLDMTMRSRKRAIKINECEHGRYKLYTHLIDKNNKVMEDHRNQLMNRIRQSVEVREAYKSVLDQYRGNNFKTLQWGFTPRTHVKTPKTYQRCKLETRVYHCGFSPTTLQPEVTEFIKLNDPARKRKQLHQRMLEAARKRSDFVIDRKITNEALLQEREKTRIESLPPIPSRDGQDGKLRGPYRIRMHTLI